eukprot:5891659-Pyramimonas_sp.AAC.1
MRRLSLLRHRLLGQVAIESGSPLWVLKRLLSMYCMPGAMDMQGIVSDVISVEQIIVPWCHFVAVMLHELLLGPLRQVHVAYRRVMPSVRVNDFALRRHGAASR